MWTRSRGVVLATSGDLANFHQERSDIWRELAEIHTAPPTARVLSAMRLALSEHEQDCTSAAHLRRALEDTSTAFADYLVLLGANVLGALSVCADKSGRHRARLMTATDRVDDGSPSSEMMGLSALAERTRRSIRHGDLGEASALCHLQHDYLVEHGVACLGSVASSLIRSGSSFYEHIGEALTHQIRDDLAMLDHTSRSTIPRISTG